MAITLNIPSQIEKYLSLSVFPATGNDFTLYIANNTNRLYQWDGATYVEVSQQDAVNWGSIGGDILNQIDLQVALTGKVNTEIGKGLSTNDYTTAEKNKLAGIESGAQVNDVDSVNGQTGSVVLTKSDIGLGNVDNTSDANKPISTATQTALNAKQDSLGFTPENTVNKSTSVVTDQASNIKYPTVKAVYDWAVGLFQTLLVSGTNIKTINGSSILGSGDLLTIPQLTTAQRDALTPVAGYPIYNTTEGYLETYDNFWGWMPVAQQNEWKRKWGMEYFQDFGGNTGFNDGVLAGVSQNGGGQGASSGTFPTANDFIGLQGLRTGAAANGNSSFRTDINFGRYVSFSGGKLQLETRLWIQTLSNATDRYNLIFGVANGFNSTITSGVTFVYDEGGVGTGTLASPNWQIITANQGVRTVINTGVPVAINAFYTFRIDINDAGTEAKYYLNGTLVYTANTNLPTGQNALSITSAITKTAGTNNINVLYDYFGIKKKFITAR